MENLDVLILCGGLGTRLRSEIGEHQKVMATVGDKPFLDIIISSLKSQGIERIVLCTGYKAENVEEYYTQNSQGLSFVFSKEEEPLGTGGAIKQAQLLIQSNPFFVLNGDSFCDVKLEAFLKNHEANKAKVSLVVSAVDEANDFGSITMDGSNRITAFQEKQGSEHYVNAGVYCFDKTIFSLMPQEKKFSLEYDVFPHILDQGMYGFCVEQSFTDIGTPERYKSVRDN